eukprot:8386921-Pyramimonas_sp.AAC.1
MRYVAGRRAIGRNPPCGLARSMIWTLSMAVGQRIQASAAQYMYISMAKAASDAQERARGGSASAPSP